MTGRVRIEAEDVESGSLGGFKCRAIAFCVLSPSLCTSAPAVCVKKRFKAVLEWLLKCYYSAPAIIR